MRIRDLKNKILKNNSSIDLEVKKDLAFQVAKHFEEARLIKGLTQKELAEKIGTNQSNIARTENGSSLPSLSFLKKVAHAFNTYLIPPKFAFMEENRDHEVNTHTSGKNHSEVIYPRQSTYFPNIDYVSTNNSKLIVIK